MSAAFLRKYATATASGTHIGLPMVKAGVQDFAVSADWTPATGDVKVSIDGGAQANIGTLPTYSNGQWLFTLTVGETTGKSIRVAVVDSATKAVEDQFFIVETFGNASAMYVVDYTSAASFGLTNLDVASSTLATSSAVAGVLTAVQNVQNGTFISASIPPLLEVPDSGSATVTLNVVFYNVDGSPDDLDSGNPTITLVNDAGTDLSSRLSVWSHPATGEYTINYTNASGVALDNLHWKITGTVNSKARKFVAMTQLVDTTAVDFTSTDRTNMGLLATAVNLAAVGTAVAAVSTTLGSPDTGSIAGDIAAVPDVNAIAGAVLSDPSNKLLTDADGKVTTSNPASVTNTYTVEESA